MNHRILVALILLTLLLPSICLAQVESPSTWGLLKSRYGQEDTIEKNGIFKTVADAIASEPLLSDVELSYVGRVGRQEDFGFFGIGMKGGITPFIVFVNGNFNTTRAFGFEAEGESPEDVGVVDLLNGGKVIWRFSAETNEVSDSQRFERNHLGTSGGVSREVTCTGAAAAAGYWAGFLPIPNKFVKGLVVGAITAATWYSCMHAQMPEYYEGDIDPVGPSENKYENKPQPGGGQ